MQLSYIYRVTKYDPADRDEHGSYTGTEDTVSDHGEVEASYLRAVAAFAADTGVGRLAVREPGIPSVVHFGVEPAVDGFGLEGLFPADLAGFHDGAEVSLDVGLLLVRAMLRDNGVWCRLEVEGTFAVHVGWDQYLYIGSSLPCEEAVARTRALGLFPERMASSPYAFGDAEEEGIQRPGDDDFWAGVHQAVVDGRAGILEELYVEGAPRWHTLTPATLAAVRAGLAPRARVAVWPSLPTDVDAVLEGLPADGGLVEGVWQDHDGTLHSGIADEDEYPELIARISGARAAALLSAYVGVHMPLCTAVMPDDDGVLRARWRNEPTPDDLDWALRRPRG
ncbi:RNA-binding protein [Streptomyces sp. NPDC003832]